MKTAGWKRAVPWAKSASFLATTFAVALLGTGCNPECVDEFDCRADNGEPPAGERWVCVDEKCETTPVEQPQPDSGTPDAGPTDSGTPDAGPTDSGTPDAGPTDSGTPDAGPTDSGTPDAGPTDDGGTPDAGPTDDGGTPDDGGVRTCDNAPYDAKLGTLELEPGFVVGEAAPLPANIAAVGSTPGPTYSLFAVQGFGKDAALYSLGTWPNLQLSATKLYDVVTPADRAGTPAVYAGGYLVVEGPWLFAGYTTGASGAPGSIAAYDTVTPASSTYVTAPKNYSAAAFSDGTTSAVLVNGGGLDTASGGLAIYGLLTSATPFSAVRVATFPTGGAAASGFTAVADNGAAALGFFHNPDFVNVIYGVAPSVVSAALTTGTPFALGDQSPIAVESDFNAAGAFGGGVAVNRGAYDADFNFVSTDVSRFALSPTMSGTVTVGPRTPVLGYVDQCTSVVSMQSLGSDLLVGLSDKNGRRLVRLQVAQ
ncbi:hypothetical protein LZ198_17030 [Myxococcus sp. K15C18031901]|uniref:hypothetical protein n=1 Tax=Myxococcus dinghuensis TaxID=2906761 RepID=UPI0020A72A35|nr:hypothetical protein [Myxococcus dinghuensis]MCP3100576.1 hypothetical protein [Myxococcus dinghuensis]